MMGMHELTQAKKAIDEAPSHCTTMAGVCKHIVWGLVLMAQAGMP